MLAQVPYDRTSAVQYAESWALKRNPRYISFNGIGGDCTNFASQCVYSGCKVMNYTKDLGWYYISPYNRSAAWSGVEFLYRFLTTNRSAGPYAEETDADKLEPGDLIQLGNENGHFYHTPVVTAVNGDEILVSAHSYDALNRPLNSYIYVRMRCLHILGARRWQ
ncbi:MAG TPA: amidase domain-containing protein [Caproicibacter sp.]|nr:amidase domain-containing protein [Caproicibacter sp.]